MKVVLIAMTLAFSAAAFASNKTQDCNAYMEAAFGEASSEVRLNLGLKALDSAAELNLTAAQATKLNSKVKSYIAQYPKKQDDFEGMFYFACTTNLDAEEKDQIKDQMFSFAEL